MSSKPTSLDYRVSCGRSEERRRDASAMRKAGPFTSHTPHAKARKNCLEPLLQVQSHSGVSEGDLCFINCMVHRACARKSTLRRRPQTRSTGLEKPFMHGLRAPKPPLAASSPGNILSFNVKLPFLLLLSTPWDCPVSSSGT